MPRSFEVTVESPVSVEEVHAAFSDEQYWLARLAAFGGSTRLSSLVVDGDQAVRVALIQDLRHDVLPSIVARFYHRDLQILHNETWKPGGDGQVHGEISVAASGAPGAGSGVASLVPTQNGSLLTFAATVEFKVPLVGGKIESFIGGQLVENIPAIQRFTTTWIMEHDLRRP